MTNNWNRITGWVNHFQDGTYEVVDMYWQRRWPFIKVVRSKGCR